MSAENQITERILPRYLEEEMKDSYISYAMSVIVGRALPDVRDGLKPVHRRILYAMDQLNIRHNQPFKKCARIVGETLGKYHPHGDSAVYDSLVRMAQDFSLRYPLIHGQGNFGSIDGDPPAAMRYTEAKLARIAEHMLEDLDKNTVDFVPNFDNSLQEPVVLPATLPNLLVNGSSGIAVGMATNIPPHNLAEVCDGIIHLLDSPDCSTKELHRIIKGPDFPTGGIICGKAEITKSYEEGRGKLVVRAKAVIEQDKNRNHIVITELPYQVNKANLLESIAALITDKKLEGISDLRDESDRDGLRVVLELKREAEPRIILNQLFKHTQLETTFGVILLALVNNKPVVLNLKQILQYYIQHRKEVIVRRTKFDLDKAQRRAHILEGLKIALKYLDEVIKTIKSSKSPQEAKEQLMKKFKLTDVQAQAILEMQLQRLTALERSKIDEEYLELIKKIEYFTSILASEKKQEAIIQEEAKALKEKFGDERRTEIVGEAEEIEVEDLIVEEDVVIAISADGYIKRQPLSAYRKQGRGGRGITAMATKEEDLIEHLFTCSSKETLLVFSSQGKVFGVKAYEVPVGSRTSKGRAIANLLNFSPQEKVAAVLAIKEFNDKQYLFMTTEYGVVKRVSLDAFQNLRKSGITALSLEKNDSLIGVALGDSDNDEVILSTQKGKAIRFVVSDVRTMGRQAQGVRGIRLQDKDKVLGMVLVNAQVKKQNLFLLTVTQRGFAKRTSVNDYRKQSRGGKGVIGIKVSPKVGEVGGVVLVAEQDEIMGITQKGVLIRCQVSTIRSSSRNTQGVRFIKLEENDILATATRIAAEESAKEFND